MYTHGCTHNAHKSVGCALYMAKYGNLINQCHANKFSKKETDSAFGALTF